MFVLSVAAIALLLPSAITTEATVTNEPESQRGYDLMVERLPPSDDFVNEVVLVHAPGRDVATDAAVKSAVETLVFELQSTGRVARVVAPLEGDSTVLSIGMGPDAEDGIKDVLEVVERADAGPYEVTITGEFTADNDFLELSNKDLKEGELFFGLPAALLVLLVVFGAVVASFVPVLLAIVAIVLALALVALVGQIWEVSFFIVNMLTGMGLALGVDYALFIVSRFREERARGHGEARGDLRDRTDREPRRALQRLGVRDRPHRDAARADTIFAASRSAPSSSASRPCLRRPRCCRRARPARRQGERRAAAVRRALRRR